MAEAYPLTFLISKAGETWPVVKGAMAYVLPAMAWVKRASFGRYDFTLEKMQADLPAMIAAMPADDLYSAVVLAHTQLGILLEEANSEREAQAKTETESVTVGASLEPTVAAVDDTDNRTDEQPTASESEPSASAEPGPDRPPRRRTRDGVRDHGQRQKRASKLVDAPLAGT